jgi:hypothetical protein
MSAMYAFSARVSRAGPLCLVAMVSLESFRIQNNPNARRVKGPGLRGEAGREAVPSRPMRRRTIWTNNASRRCCLAVLALAALLVADASAADEIETLRSENARLGARVRELEAELTALRGGAAPATTDAGGAGARMEPVYIPRSRVSLEVTRDEASGATDLATLWYRTADTSVLPRKEWLQLRARQDAGGALGGVWLMVERQAPAGGTKPSSGRLTIDGAVVELPVEAYDVKRRSQGVGPISANMRDELIRFTLPPAVLAQVAASRKAQFDAGAIEFELTDEHVAAFAAMATRVGAGAQAASVAAPAPR